jgi:hypothetical protein
VFGEDPTRVRDLSRTHGKVDQTTGQGLKFVFLERIDFGEKRLEVEQHCGLLPRGKN